MGFALKPDQINFQLVKKLLRFEQGAGFLAGLSLAVAATLQLREARIDEAAIGRGLASAVWPARFQRLTKGPFGDRAQAAGADLWLDGGHNPHAALALARTVGDMAARDGRPVAIICGLLANKDPIKINGPTK